MEDYERIKPTLYPENPLNPERMRRYAQLLDERAQLEETLQQMQQKLDEQTLINEAEKEAVEPA